MAQLHKEASMLGESHELRDMAGSGHSSNEHEDFDDLEHLDKVTNAVGYAPEEEQTVLKKLDKRVVGLISLLYLLSFLDRSNIGNAKIAGMMNDLRLNDDQYEWLLSAFYITYIAFEWMALLFKLVPPHVYLFVVVLSWGILASIQSITSNFTQLIILRATLGISEAAFCGVPFYLSFFFRREELAFRTGLFISAAPLATTFASSVAWIITALADKTPIAAWRLLFLIEGFPSVIVAWYCYQNVADSPGSAWFLTRRERKLAVKRLEESGFHGDEVLIDEKHAPKSARRSVNLREVFQTLKDPKCYLTAAMFFSCNVAFSSMPVFLPTILEDMVHSSLWAQALSAPPYLVSFFVVLYAAYASDKRATRSPFVIFFALLAAGGYSLILLCGLLGLPNWLRYFGVYPACAGFFCCVTIIITWTLNNQDSEAKKGAGIAILQFLGQCGPLLGTRLFPAEDGPLYSRGMLVCALFMAAVAVLATALRVVIRRENRTRQLQAGLDTDGDVERPLVGDETEQRKRQIFLLML